MRYFINYIFLLIIKFFNKFGKGFYLKSNFLNSEIILRKNFKEKSDFLFIQVGANDGISFDFLYDFVVKRNPSGIVIEPIKEYFEELSINYKDFPNIRKVNCAVHPVEKNVTIYKISSNSKHKYPDWVKGIASLDPLHHRKTNIDSNDIVNDYVESDNLMNIINGYYEHIKVDYFQIDTEGFDWEVLKMIDFSRLKPSILKYESVNLSAEDKRKSLNFLQEKGYYLFNESGDTVAIDLHKMKIF